METITITLLNGAAHIYYQILSHQQAGNILELLRPEDAIFAEDDIPTEWQNFHQGIGTNKLTVTLPTGATVDVKK